jgi:vesicle-fusing ATPase
MDGVEQLNNILVIGMTNRKELIDEALLRPGRFEVHVEIGLADEAGRLQILKIHTKKMVEANFMAPDVDLHYLAEHTKNFSGAELEGLVKSAASFAFYGQVDVTKDQQVAPKKQLATMKVTMEHFKQALQEVKPAFGVEEEELKRYLRGGFIDYGPDFNHLLNSCKTLIEQVRNSPRTPLLSVLLQGASGCGKTALATYLGISSQFPFVKMVSAEDMVGWGEMEKARKMEKIFRDAYKSPLSIIIIDEIERLLEYVSIGPRFSNTMLQTMLVLLKKPPPTEGRKLLLIGTTSAPHLLEQMSFRNAFNVVLEVPQVKTGDEIRTGTCISAIYVFALNLLV